MGTHLFLEPAGLWYSNCRVCSMGICTNGLSQMTPRWQLNDSWITQGWLPDDVLTPGWLQDDSRMTPGWLLDDTWMTLGWLKDDFRMNNLTPGRLLEDSWMTPGRLLDDSAWWLLDDTQMTPGWYPDDYWVTPTWLPGDYRMTQFVANQNFWMQSVMWRNENVHAFQCLFFLSRSIILFFTLKLHNRF